MPTLINKKTKFSSKDHKTSLSIDDIYPEGNLEKAYSVGEIYKLKLLKTRLNKPVKSKSHVAKIVRSLQFKSFKTKTGHEAHGLTIEQIEEYNQNKLK